MSSFGVNAGDIDNDEKAGIDIDIWHIIIITRNKK